MKSNPTVTAWTVTAAALLAGCATSIPISGETVAGNSLRSDVAEALRRLAPVTVACPRPSKVEAIHMKVLEVRPPTSSDANSSQRRGEVIETWTATICGQQVPYRISFTPRPDGRTDYLIGRSTP